MHCQQPCPGVRRPWRCHATTLGPREDTQNRGVGGRTGLGGGSGGKRVGIYVVISSPEMYTILGATILALSELIALAPPTSLLAAPATTAPAAVVPRHRADTCPAPDKRGVIAARAPLRRRIPARDTIAKTARSYLEAFQLFYKSFKPEWSNLTMIVSQNPDFPRGGGVPASFPGTFSLCAWPLGQCRGNSVQPRPQK